MPKAKMRVHLNEIQPWNSNIWMNMKTQSSLLFMWTKWYSPIFLILFKEMSVFYAGKFYLECVPHMKCSMIWWKDFCLLFSQYFDKSPELANAIYVYISSNAKLAKEAKQAAQMFLFNQFFFSPQSLFSLFEMILGEKMCLIWTNNIYESHGFKWSQRK